MSQTVSSSYARVLTMILRVKYHHSSPHPQCSRDSRDIASLAIWLVWHIKSILVVKGRHRILRVPTTLDQNEPTPSTPSPPYPTEPCILGLFGKIHHRLEVAVTQNPGYLVYKGDYTTQLYREDLFWRAHSLKHAWQNHRWSRLLFFKNAPQKFVQMDDRKTHGQSFVSR